MSKITYSTFERTDGSEAIIAPDRRGGVEDFEMIKVPVTKDRALETAERRALHKYT